MKAPIVLVGNAVTAQILHPLLDSDPRYEVIGVTVDDEFAANGSISRFTTIPMSRLSATIGPRDCRVVMAIGYNDLNRVRESVFDRLGKMGYSFETFVHPDARVYSDVPLGPGCVILPGTVIEPQVRVGANTMIWSNAILAHHCTVGEHCWIAAGAVVSGQATVQRNSFLGVSSTIVNDVAVGEYNIIGASALISKNTKPYSVHLARSAELLRYSAEDYVKNFKL